MISIKEKRILDKFKNIYEMKLTNKPINNIDDYKNIKIDDTTFNKKMILKFINSLTEEEKNYTIYHSLLFVQNNNYEFIKQFTNSINKYGKNLEKYDNYILNQMIKYTIEFILTKENTLINPDIYTKFNKKYSDYLTKLNYYEMYSLPTVYRNILKSILFFSNDYVQTLNDIFTSNKYDEIIINYLNKDELNIFKNYLIRLIYFDAYVLIKNELKILLDEIFIFAEAEDIENIILNYIDHSIKNNIYKIPNNKEIKTEIFYAFLDFFLDENDKENAIKNVEKTSEKKLRLLNPLYKIDEY